MFVLLYGVVFVFNVILIRRRKCSGNFFFVVAYVTMLHFETVGGWCVMCTVSCIHGDFELCLYHKVIHVFIVV